MGMTISMSSGSGLKMKFKLLIEYDSQEAWNGGKSG